MPRWVDTFEEFAVDVILERRYGKRAAMLRLLLRGLSRIYEPLVQARLGLFRQRFFRSHQLGIPVISVGNLTVGGTGKTPVVERLARELRDGGRRVAILSRGYKSRRPPLLRRWFGRRIEGPRIVSTGEGPLLDSATSGDEPFMLAKNLPGVAVFVDKNRVKSGLHAIRTWGADVILLDDGMQYQRLQHRIDVVLVDRLAPFGNDCLLPRGTLREPPRNLRRARYILITKSRPGASNLELIERIREYNRTAEIIECRHRPVHLENLRTGEHLPLSSLEGKFYGAMSGIATPESFENSLRDLGALLEITARFADHHRFTAKEIKSFSERCIRRDVDAILTTEKDAVRIPAVETGEMPIYFLRVEIEILSGHPHWEHFIRRLCEPQPLVRAEKLYG